MARRAESGEEGGRRVCGVVTGLAVSAKRYCPFWDNRRYTTPRSLSPAVENGDPNGNHRQEER